MKTVKINEMSKQRLSKKEMSLISGGDGNGVVICSCGCQYADSGGSSINANCAANNLRGLTVPKGVEIKHMCGTGPA